MPKKSIENKENNPVTSQKTLISEGNYIINMFLYFIKSRACKDAIKFNDILSSKILRDIVSGLTKCENPFLCAHGRHNFFLIIPK